MRNEFVLVENEMVLVVVVKYRSWADRGRTFRWSRELTVDGSKNVRDQVSEMVYTDFAKMDANELSFTFSKKLV